MENTGKKPEEFAIMHELRILSYDPDQVLDTIDGCGHYLLGFRSHPCVFLGKDNLCTIHEFAPMSCRRYPYQINDKLNTRFCPLPSQLLFRMKGPDIKPDPLITELDAHKKIVKEWNARPGKKDDCIPFLLERARSAAPDLLEGE
jgi:Fe-S-cluster containining protein